MALTISINIGDGTVMPSQNLQALHCSQFKYHNIAIYVHTKYKIVIFIAFYHVSIDGISCWNKFIAHFPVSLSNWSRR